MRLLSRGLILSSILAVGISTASAEPETGARPASAVATYEQGQAALQAGDRAKAIQLMDSACKEGYAEGCYNLARAYDRYQLRPVNEDDKLETYVRGCEGGHGLACKEAAYNYVMKGFSDPAMNPVGLKYRIRACEINEPISCSAAGDAYLTGKPGVEKDYEAARPYLEKACEMDMSSACAYLAQVHAYGWGVDVNLEKARDYIIRARSLTDDNTIVDDIIAELNYNFR